MSSNCMIQIARPGALLTASGRFARVIAQLFYSTAKPSSPAGDSRASALNTAEIYDSASGTWSGPAIPIINGLLVSGKKLFVVGQGFAPGAMILVNGIEQKTRNQDEQTETVLVGKNAAKRIKRGDKIHVINPNGTISDQLTFELGN